MVGKAGGRINCIVRGVGRNIRGHRKEVIMNIEVSKTIRKQIGNRALYWMGTQRLTAIKNGLGIRFNGSRKSNYIEIILTPMDMYAVKFFKVTYYDERLVSEHHDIYCDQLKELIENKTGLYLSL